MTFRDSIPVCTAILIGVGITLGLDSVSAQVSTQQRRPQFPIHLPARQVFSVNTAVSVPDGGTMSLGGVTRSNRGSTLTGTPLLSRIPGVGRGFRNRSHGGEISHSLSSVRVRIISNREIDEQLLTEAARREQARQTIDPNGSLSDQRRADFITRNIGRRR